MLLTSCSSFYHILLAFLIIIRETFIMISSIFFLLILLQKNFFNNFVHAICFFLNFFIVFSYLFFSTKFIYRIISHYCAVKRKTNYFYIELFTCYLANLYKYSSEKNWRQYLCSSSKRYLISSIRAFLDKKQNSFVNGAISC